MGDDGLEGATWAYVYGTIPVAYTHISCVWFHFPQVSLGMYLGAKIGILGANGAGKSSVLRILAGEDDQFDGHIDKSPGIRVTHLKQVWTLRGSCMAGIHDLSQGPSTGLTLTAIADDCALSLCI